MTAQMRTIRPKHANVGLVWEVYITREDLNTWVGYDRRGAGRVESPCQNGWDYL